jgi:hypothetical protein
MIRRSHSVRILPEDVKDILGLEIEGLNVTEHIGSKHTKKMDKLLDGVFVKLADLNKKELTISKLQTIITESATADDDFKRAFVLFTIGVVLAPTKKDFVHSSYLPLIRYVSQIWTFNWGEFTLYTLLDGIHTYTIKKSASISGNLALLQVGSICNSQHL